MVLLLLLLGLFMARGPMPVVPLLVEAIVFVSVSLRLLVCMSGRRISCSSGDETLMRRRVGSPCVLGLELPRQVVVGRYWCGRVGASDLSLLCSGSRLN